MNAFDLLTVAVLGFVGVRLVSAARVAVRTPARRHTNEIIKGLEAHHFLLAPVALTGVLVVSVALYAIPPLRFGWWTAIGGTGNIVTGGTTRTNGTVWAWLTPLGF